jgi:drug/metabolite transporter (DMT)-like permease
MPPIVLGMIALAALMHAAWNVLLKRSGDPLITSGRAMIAGSIVTAPFAVAAWWIGGRPGIPPEAFALGILSGLIEVVYLILLAGAYRRGDLSVVYPIARGTAPLLSIAAGVGLLGERLGPVGALGVAALVGGLLVVQRPWRFLRGGPIVEKAVPWALACGVTIATYSTIDRVGARLTEPWLFAAILFPVTAAGMAVVITVAGRRTADGRRTSPGAAMSWSRSAAAGLLAVMTYVLILAAFSIAPLSVVAPLRESAIVLGSAWGALRMGEARGGRDATRRLIAAGLIVVGVVLVALER